MLTASLLLLGSLLLVLALAETPVRRLPLSPALVYLAAGALAGVMLDGPTPGLIAQHALPLQVATEFAVLVSLVAVGMRLRVPPTLAAWRVAWLLAGPAMLVTIALATLAGWLLLDLPLAAAWLLASILAPTDPVLASEVQIRSDVDRDAVRMAISAEGGLNDGTALPAVMLGLGFLGLHELGDNASRWWWADLGWPIGGGLLVGAALGLLLGKGLQARLARGHAIEWDELVYVGTVALAYGLARATETSAFVVAFASGATLLLPVARKPIPASKPAPLPAAGSALESTVQSTIESAAEPVVEQAAGSRLQPLSELAADPALPVAADAVIEPAVQLAAGPAPPVLIVPDGPGDVLAARLHAFGGRCERLVEAAAVTAVGVALSGLVDSLGMLLPMMMFALLLVLLLRPLAVMLTVPGRVMPPSQRRLVAWFGIRGVGTLFYLAFVLTEGVSGELATKLIGASLCCVAVSIVLHGISATPLMAAYHGRQLGRNRAGRG